MTSTIDYSANVRAEVARAGRTTTSVILAMQHMNRPKWMRRMAKPELWSVVELQQIAAVLGIPLERLTKDPREE